MKEFDLIRLLRQSIPGHPSVIVGPGDDCAVLEPAPSGHQLLFKTDAIVEGIHFTSGTEPRRIGHKALARCLSDVAAMGGTPRSAVVTLGLPDSADSTLVLAIYEGMQALGVRHGVSIAGGETTTNPDRLLISIALIGHVPVGKALLRSGARAGDGIFVTGDLGGSIHGKHLDFEPRLREARWLATNFPIHSMIDLSDGMAGDLRHILHESGVGAELHETAIPVNRAVRLSTNGSVNNKPALLAALTDGEDYELLFTLAPGNAVRLKDAWKQEFPDLKLSCVGRITSEPGLRIRTRTGIRQFTENGYEHFSQH